MKTKDYNFADALAEKVEARMYSLKITKADLHRISGLSYATIKTILDHKCYSPSENTLNKLAFGLAMTKERLINFTV